MPVQFNDVLQLPETSKWVPTNVQWRQRMKSHEKKYFSVNYMNTRDDPEKSGILFVSEEKFADFESQKMQRNDSGSQITVDRDFVYGQKNADGDLRFLVYHDTDRDIYQHRFQEGFNQILERVLNDASSQGHDKYSKISFDDINTAREFIAGSFGDPLRKFGGH